jgi:hypothetical protein
MGGTGIEAIQKPAKGTSLDNLFLMNPNPPFGIRHNPTDKGGLLRRFFF